MGQFLNEEFMEEEVEEMEVETKENINQEQTFLDFDEDEIELSTEIKVLAQQYKNEGKQIYIVTASIYIDDLRDKQLHYLFGKPNVASYDRYVKTMAVSNTKALKTFVLDNIVPEQRAELRGMLNKYPALAISLGEKLLAMLGLAKDVAVKKL